jgi:hypothetical protein
MNAAPNPNWEPDSQWLAAYFDGELEGRDDLIEMRARVEAWLEAHPEALEQCAKLRQLQKLWLDTTPVEPTNAAWQQCRGGIDARRAAIERTVPRMRRPWRALGAIAAGVALFVGALFGVWRFAPSDIDSPTPLAIASMDEPMEVFAVAQSDEITILRVEGADTGALVVGTLPLAGLLELADPGDVSVLHMCPDARDQMVPNVRDRGRPLIWARIDVE